MSLKESSPESSQIGKQKNKLSKIVLKAGEVTQNIAKELKYSRKGDLSEVSTQDTFEHVPFYRRIAGKQDRSVYKPRSTLFKFGDFDLNDIENIVSEE